MCWICVKIYNQQFSIKLLIFTYKYPKEQLYTFNQCQIYQENQWKKSNHFPYELFQLNSDDGSVVVPYAHVDQFKPFISHQPYFDDSSTQDKKKLKITNLACLPVERDILKKSYNWIIHHMKETYPMAINGYKLIDQKSLIDDDYDYY